MTELQFEHLKEGDIVTPYQGPNKDKILKVVEKIDGIRGLFGPQLTCVPVNTGDILLVGKYRTPSDSVTGSFRTFKLVYAPNELKEIQRKHVVDPTRKLTPSFDYYLEAYEKSNKNFDKLGAWNRIRVLTCYVYGVNVVQDIPDELVPEAIECAKSFIDNFIKWNVRETS